MSKLAQAITAKITNERSISYKLPRTYSVELERTSLGNFGDVLTGYDIGLVIHQRGYVNDSEKGKQNIHSEMLYSLKRDIIEEVFGEFRPYIIEMRSALYDRDDTRMHTLLAELENKMFVEGL